MDVSYESENGPICRTGRRKVSYGEGVREAGMRELPLAWARGEAMVAGSGEASCAGPRRYHRLSIS